MTDTHSHTPLARDIRGVAFVFVVALVLQLSFLIGITTLLSSYDASVRLLVQHQDAAEFIALGHSIAESGTFAFPPSFHPDNRTFPETFRTPGYPIFVAFFITLFGHMGTLSEPSPTFFIHLMALCMLGALTSGLIYAITRALSVPRRYALSAAIAFSVSPAVIFLPVSGMGSDMLFACLFTLALLLVIRLDRTSRPILSVMGIGLALGWAALSRPAGLYLAYLVLASLPFFIATHTNVSRKILHWLIALLCFLLILVPWLTRNYEVSGHFDLSSIPIYSAGYYNIPMFLSFYHGTPEGEERNKLVAQLGNPPDKLLRSFAYTDEWRAIDIAFLKEYFWPYSIFHGMKMLPFFFGSGLDVQYAVVDIETGSRLDVPFMPKVDENLSKLVFSGDVVGVIKNLFSFWPATLERVVWLLLFTLVAVSAFLAQGRDRRFLILGVVLIAVAAVLASPVAQPRYRVPLEPIIWSSAAYGAWMLMQHPRFVKVTNRIRGLWA